MSDDPKSPKGLRPPLRREAPDQIPRGFKAVDAAREDRNKIARPPWKVAAWFGLPIIVALAMYIRWDSNRVETERQELMARQRAVEAELGSKWYPLRETVESFTTELANGPDTDVVLAEDLAKLDFQSEAGIYLRVSRDQAKDPESIRKAASKSLRDGFTACLMRTPGDDPFAGKECKVSRECDPGQLCNEFLHCAKPGQPYNLRLAYKALFVLSPEWVRDVQDADNDLRVRALKLTFDDANSLEFPIAVDFLTKARFFLVAVDEREAPATPELDDADVLEGKTWPTRVALYRLSDKKLLLRMRREPKGQLMGGAPIKDSGVAAARIRQARSCELALDVRRALGDAGLQAPTDPGPGSSATPSDSAAPSASASAAASASSAPAVPASAASSAGPTGGAAPSARP